VRANDLQRKGIHPALPALPALPRLRSRSYLASYGEARRSAFGA
jgi:hypothetical protein